MHLITRLDLGGAQQNTLYCTEHHDRTHFEVALLAGRGGLLDHQAERIDDAEIELVPWLPHAIRPLTDALAVLRLRRELRERRIDLLHTHSSKAGMLGRLAARLAGVPVVVHTVHGWSFNDTQPAWLRGLYVVLERAAAALTDRLVVVAEGNRDEGLARGIGRARQYAVIRSGIDASLYRRPGRAREAVRRDLGYTDEHVVVGSVACLKPQKAPLDFVRAAARAIERDPSLRFFIAGDGELRDAVLEEIARSGLEGRVQLLGWRDDVADLLHAMDVFLLTSRFEGLPRAVLQAMAAGTPVVATAVDGTPEVVEDGVTGRLVPPGDPERTAAAVVELAADPTGAAMLARRAAERLDDAFDIGRMVRDLDSLYLALLSPNGAAGAAGAAGRD